jgi:hypothetical protein
LVQTGNQKVVVAAIVFVACMIPNVDIILMIEMPKEPGEAQRELGIEKEVISFRSSILKYPNHQIFLPQKSLQNIHRKS